MSERNRRDPDALTDVEWAFLNDVEDPAAAPRELWELRWNFEGRTRRLWQAYGAAVLQGWVERHPATRPALWWTWDAPRDPAGAPGSGEIPAEPRRRLGGTGQALHEVGAVVPRYAFGIPVDWLTANLAKHMPGTAIDESDPPRFESEAAYLARHGLLLPIERAFARRTIRLEDKREAAGKPTKPRARAKPKPKAPRSRRTKPKAKP